MIAAAAARDDDWPEEASARWRPLHGPPQLSLEGFDGPLDFLLEMARRKRIDLSRMSLMSLCDQLSQALSTAASRVPLERQADWVVMASSLVQLKSQLLAPVAPTDDALAEGDAERRAWLFRERGRLSAMVAWLEARPQLGRDVFARGRPEFLPPETQCELYVGFLEATLRLLEGRLGREVEQPLPAWQPAPLYLWRVPDALQRLLELLDGTTGPQPLQRFLPDALPENPTCGFQLRAAIGSTFVAALELARNGELVIEQHQMFGPIAVRLSVQDMVRDAAA